MVLTDTKVKFGKLAEWFPVATALLLALSAYPGKVAHAQTPAAQATIAEKTKGLTARPGLIESYVDARQGKAYLKLNPPNATSGEVGQFLYAESLVTGLGSNDLGIDRTQFGNTYVLDIKEIGGKVLFQVPNLNFRADSGSPEEQRANAGNFATSIIWAGPVAAVEADGSSLVDITDFLIRDAHDISPKLLTQGAYQLDKNRSVLSFPIAAKHSPKTWSSRRFLLINPRGRAP